MPYPHQILLQKSGLKKEDLSSDLQILIDDFEEKEKLALEKETTEEKVDVLTAQSNVLAQNIYDYYVDSDDQGVEITVDAPKEDIIEAAAEIKEELENKEEPTAEPKIEGPVATEQVIPPATEPVAEVKTEQPKADPVAAAIAAGAATPPLAESAEELAVPTTPAAQESVKAEAIAGYAPKGEEKILFDLYQSGKKENLSRSELQAAGIDTGFWGKLEGAGGVYGRCVLRRMKDSSNYNLTFK